MKFILLLIFLLLSRIAQSQLTIDVKKVRTLVQSWSDAHNNNDIDAFNKLYGPSVLFYTQNLKKEICLEKKAEMLAASDFHLDITTALTIAAYTGGTIKCEFTKRVVYNSVEKSYPSYLLLQQINDGYKIVGESDLITDGNLKYHLDLGKRMATRDGPLARLPADEQDVPKQTGNNRWWIALILSFVTLALVIIVVSKMTFGKSSLKEIQPVDVASKVNPKDKKERSVEIVAPAFLQDKYEQMGKEFEAFVIRKFDANFFLLKRWQADLGIDGRFPLANRDPDLEFLYLHSYPFAVECKFRTKLFRGKFEIEGRKLDNYRRFSESNRMTVHIVLGLAGEPGNPAQLYVIPLHRFKNTTELSFDQLQTFRHWMHKNFYYDKENSTLT
jgi:hypothetical protein